MTGLCKLHVYSWNQLLWALLNATGENYIWALASANQSYSSLIFLGMMLRARLAWPIKRKVSVRWALQLYFPVPLLLLLSIGLFCRTLTTGTIFTQSGYIKQHVTHATNCKKSLKLKCQLVFVQSLVISLQSKKITFLIYVVATS